MIIRIKKIKNKIKKFIRDMIVGKRIHKVDSYKSIHNWVAKFLYKMTSQNLLYIV